MKGEGNHEFALTISSIAYSKHQDTTPHHYLKTELYFIYQFYSDSCTSTSLPRTHFLVIAGDLDGVSSLRG